MRARCRRCGTTIGSPSAVGCVTTVVPAALITGVAIGCLIPISRWFVLAAVPLWILMTWLFWEGPRYLVMLRNRFTSCPQCQARDWERPEYSGFGL